MGLAKLFERLLLACRRVVVSIPIGGYVDGGGLRSSCPVKRATSFTAISALLFMFRSSSSNACTSSTLPRGVRLATTLSSEALSPARWSFGEGLEGTAGGDTSSTATAVAGAAGSIVS